MLSYSLAHRPPNQLDRRISDHRTARIRKCSPRRSSGSRSQHTGQITVGGIERQDSVRIALELTSAESDLVIVHDAPAARDPGIFDACLSAASRAGAAIAAIPVSDTLKRVADNTITATIARASLWQAQTPQAFRRAVLVTAHQRAVREKNRSNRRRRPGRAHRRPRRGSRSLNHQHQDHNPIRSRDSRSTHRGPHMRSGQEA